VGTVVSSAKLRIAAFGGWFKDDARRGESRLTWIHGQSIKEERDVPPRGPVAPR
jgi:hypothetical protein